MAKPNTLAPKMKKSGSLRPPLRFSFRLQGTPDQGFLEILPIKRHWPAIIIMAFVTAGFTYPLLTLRPFFGETEDLFDLTFSLFTLFWGLGWSVGVLILLTVLIALLFAREVLIVEPDRIRLRMEVLNLGLESTMRGDYLSKLRYVTGDKLPGSTWRGNHLAVDYLQVPVSFGCNLDHTEALALMERTAAALNNPIPVQLPQNILDGAKNHAETIRRDQADALVNVEASTKAEAQTGGGGYSVYFLIAANLVPFGGVFLLEWNIGDIMLLYWAESAIIGFFNILKMFRIAGLVAVFYGFFFIGHFGAFMAVHLLFIFGLFIEEGGRAASLSEVASMFGYLWTGILALFISHGFSYYQNFLGRKEYLSLTIKAQMHKPYTRIVLMHLTLIFGGFLVLALDAKLLALALLIVLKTLTDLVAHNKEHLRGNK